MRRLRATPTLRGRLALMALVAGALWIAVLTTVFNLALDNRLRQQADDVVRTRAEAVGATVEARPDGRLTVREPAQDQALDTGVWIYQGRQAVEKPPGASAALRRQADRLAGKSHVFADSSGSSGPGPWRLYALPVATSDGSGQAGTVVASVSLDPYRSTADTALAASTALAVALLAGIYLLTRLVVRRALQPVAAMSDQAARWSESAAPERFGSAGRPAELGALAANLDVLLDRLAAALRHEQHQAAELSHELRTPLARVTAETDWLNRRPRDAAEQRTSHEAIAGAAATMRQICDSLLSEVRTRESPAPGRCRFPDVIHRLTGRDRPGSADAPTVTVEGDPADIGVSEEVAERILTPLLDNARRYARHTVTVRCTAGTGRITLHVGDDGPGVPEEFRSSLFEPGRRADPGDGHDGAGLGLALARRLARAAGGDIELSGAGPGASFAVSLPAG
ncbi:HAMP domain-containing sensor histidine kinase [Streptomyces niveus]|uniref:HAMP domain-containing sensor histidine kinase n=1 Tax=Streptomyces niveus TaxID=193462 RepID=UPI00344A63DD